MSYGTDRYGTNPLDGAAGFADHLRSIERRISALEGAPLNGTFTSPDANGANFVFAGALPDGDRGFELRSDTHGWDLLRATADDGWTAPHLQAAPYDPSGPKVVTPGSFAAVWGCLFGDALGAGVEIMIPFTTAASTTGEVRVVDNALGTTSTHTLPAATSSFAFRAVSARLRGWHGTSRPASGGAPRVRGRRRERVPVPRLGSRSRIVL